MKKQDKEKKITIPPISIKTARITLVGDTPLLVHKFSEKSKRQMDDKTQGKAKNKKAPRDPQQEYKDSLYVFNRGKKSIYGMPASGIKNAAVSACRYVDGMSMTKALGSFHVLEESNGLVEIQGKPTLDERIVRIGGFGNKVAQTRYRGRFDDWKVMFNVRYNENVVTVEQLVNLFENAGFAVGLCEYRPEKRGNLGCFHVQRG